ncbi:hypothetical protein Gpo141_00010324 [Globisporangium polare]
MSKNASSSSSRPMAGAGIASDECDYDDTEEDRDMILSKEDFEMLHVLHRFVPLPALSSKILRIICDDDLEVAHEEDGDADETPASLATTAENDSGPRLTPLRRASLSSSESAGAAIPKHSPLTRRLSKTPIKPRIEINLAPSPQHQKKLQQHEPANNNDLDPSHEDRVRSITFTATSARTSATVVLLSGGSRLEPRA